MKVNTGVLKTAESELRMCRNRIEGLNDELRATIAAISDMRGIEGYARLKRISYDIEYSSYILSEMSDIIGNVAEAYERNEEKVIAKRESSYLQYLGDTEVDTSTFFVLGPGGQRPDYSMLINSIERFFEGD